jgi:hypothetical protein
METLTAQACHYAKKEGARRRERGNNNSYMQLDERLDADTEERKRRLHKRILEVFYERDTGGRGSGSPVAWLAQTGYDVFCLYSNQMSIIYSQ